MSFRGILAVSYIVGTSSKMEMEITATNIGKRLLHNIVHTYSTEVNKLVIQKRPQF